MLYGSKTLVAVETENVSDLQYYGYSVDLSLDVVRKKSALGTLCGSRLRGGDLYEEICMGDLYGRKGSGQDQVLVQSTLNNGPSSLYCAPSPKLAFHPPQAEQQPTQALSNHKGSVDQLQNPLIRRCFPRFNMLACTQLPLPKVV